MLSSPQRQIIFHFHLFKNAGTSIDVNLQRIFADIFFAIGLSLELRQANSLDMRLHRLALETLESRLISTQ